MATKNTKTVQKSAPAGAEAKTPKGAEPRTQRVLFICTGNACRSQIAEALLHHFGGPAFEAHSAGTRPAGFVHGLALDALGKLGIPLLFAESKGVEQFEKERLDIIVTLCDFAAAQPMPPWLGDPLTAHWPLPDPVMHAGSEEDRQALALTVANRLKAKIGALMRMDRSAPREMLLAELKRLGEI